MKTPSKHLLRACLFPSNITYIIKHKGCCDPLIIAYRIKHSLLFLQGYIQVDALRSPNPYLNMANAVPAVNNKIYKVSHFMFKWFLNWTAQDSFWLKALSDPVQNTNMVYCRGQWKPEALGSCMYLSPITLLMWSTGALTFIFFISKLPIRQNTR